MEVKALHPKKYQTERKMCRRKILPFINSIYQKELTSDRLTLLINYKIGIINLPYRINKAS